MKAEGKRHFGALVALLWSIATYAQAPTGEIRVEVKDPSGAFMRAAGKLEDLQSRTTRSFHTDANGRYTFRNLSYGRYRLEVSRQGFATQSVPVEVRSSTPVVQSMTMVLGAATERVDVVATTPVAGGSLTPLEIPAPVQTATQQDLTNSGALDLSDLLNRRLSGVFINENQENPFQPDINYRGYTASPLLGTPEGLSVYLDGVRQNQPFGDVVAWDLIPRIAISEMALLPGSNPMFGLNTLGGAVSIETKDGRNTQGTKIQASGGSWGRRAFEVEHGGMSSKGLSWYAAGHLFHEDGWRVASPSDVRQMFGKLGWQGPKTNLSLSFAYADNELVGNGLQEQRLLARDYSSGYTLGDVTTNRSPFFNLSVRHAATSALTFSANAYFRYIRSDTVNPNLNTDSLDESVYQPSAADQAALKAAGYTGYPTSGANASNTPFPYWRCIAQALQLDEPVEKCNAVIVHGFTKQNNYGLSGQATWSTSPGGHRNQLTAGSSWDRSSLTFQQSTQFGYINPDYTVTPVNAFEDGSTNSDGVPVDSRVNLHGLPQTWSVYATDTLSAGGWNVTVSGRYNRATVNNRDRINPGGGQGSLDGRYVFSRFNPAAGVTFSPVRSINLYASYSESSRAPTSIELGCADPDNPCSLPNALSGDPPLRQVITRTLEAGVRGAQESGRLSWSAGWFRAANRNDLLFVSDNQTGNGYFKNFGRTLRQGAEAHLSGRIQRVTLGGNYTFLRATYESPETVDGSGNSSNDMALAGSPGLGGVIQIQPGDRIPLIPQHMFKAFANVQATKKISAGLDFLAVSSSYARGNENHQQIPDGVYYLGPGKCPGYGVLNLEARYQVHPHLQIFGQINNVLDHRYYTAAQLGVTGFTAQGTFLARPLPPVNGNYPLISSAFYAPGAPIGAWGGLRLTF
ncbi:MAG TPA: TonB-dependent receptor [Verrucomicrobiae bacterium]|nr:TonB-dependent receptor [Verrucomicrobiae bacterium]